MALAPILNQLNRATSSVPPVLTTDHGLKPVAINDGEVNSGA